MEEQEFERRSQCEKSKRKKKPESLLGYPRSENEIGILYTIERKIISQTRPITTTTTTTTTIGHI